MANIGYVTYFKGCGESQVVMNYLHHWDLISSMLDKTKLLYEQANKQTGEVFNSHRKHCWHYLVSGYIFKICIIAFEKRTFTFKDTQEAPKSLSIDSSSSLESLASIDNDFSHSDNELNMCSTPKSTSKSMPRILPPFKRTVLPSKRLGGAFTSYVRRRGEPDGRTSNPLDGKSTTDSKIKKNGTLARPGGGESDAAFTPSPPVVLQVCFLNI